MFGLLVSACVGALAATLVSLLIWAPTMRHVMSIRTELADAKLLLLELRTVYARKTLKEHVEQTPVPLEPFIHVDGPVSMTEYKRLRRMREGYDGAA